MQSLVAKPELYKLKYNVDVPQVSVEELKRYLDENPQEIFSLEDPCDCLLHNYLEANRPKKAGECYRINGWGIGVLRDVNWSAHPVAKLPEKFATFLHKKVNGGRYDDWPSFNAEQVKTLLDYVENGKDELAEAFFHDIVRNPEDDEE